MFLLDSRGIPIRRRIGFVGGYDPEPDDAPEAPLISNERIDPEPGPEQSE